jgi:signal transduction histidine kinase
VDRENGCKILRKCVFVAALCPVLMSLLALLWIYTSVFPGLKSYFSNLEFFPLSLIFSLLSGFSICFLMLKRAPYLVKSLGFGITLLSSLSLYEKSLGHEAISHLELPITLSIFFLVLGLFLMTYSHQVIKTFKNSFFSLTLVVIVFFFGWALTLSVLFPIFTSYIFPQKIYFDLFSSLIIITFSFSCAFLIVIDLLLDFVGYVKFVPFLAFEFFLLLTTCFALGVRSEKIHLFDLVMFTHKELDRSVDNMKKSLQRVASLSSDIRGLMKDTGGDEEKIKAFIKEATKKNPSLTSALILDKSIYVDPGIGEHVSSYQEFLERYLKIEKCEQITESNQTMFFVLGKKESAIFLVVHPFCYGQEKIGLLVMNYSFSDFLNKSVGSKVLEEFYLEIESNGKLIFSNLSEFDPSFEKYHQVSILIDYNISWTVTLSSKNPDYVERAEVEIFWITLLGGIFLSTVISYSLYLWMVVRKKEERLYEVQNSLLEYQGFLNIALSTARIGVWKYTIANKGVYLDPHMYEIFEIPNEVEISKLDEFLGVFPDEEAASFRERINLLNCKSSYLSFKTSFKQKNGKVKYLFSRGEVIADEKRMPKYVIGVTHDVTAREKLEGVKSEFISNISHSLRTPLTSIHGGIILLQKELKSFDNAKVVDLLSIAHKNSAKMLDLITKLLDIQKMDEGCLKFDFKSLSILKLVKESIDMSTPAATQKSMEIKLETPDVDAEVRGDYLKLIEVMDNLLSNAIKFSYPNSQIFIRLIKNSEFIRVEVEDKGEGMSRDFENLVFTRFSREDILNRKEGSGIGLNASQKIIEAHKGTLSFRTELKKGSTFYFDMPLNFKKENHD